MEECELKDDKDNDLDNERDREREKLPESEWGEPDLDLDLVGDLDWERVNELPFDKWALWTEWLSTSSITCMSSPSTSLNGSCLTIAVSENKCSYDDDKMFNCDIHSINVKICEYVKIAKGFKYRKSSWKDCCE